MLFFINLCESRGVCAGDVAMVMDILLLMIMVLTIFFCMRKGFAMSVVGFFKGFVSLIIAWIFCDDLAAWLIKSTPVGTAMSGKINEGLSAKWENSDIYMALPDLFKENGADAAAGSLITDGSDRIANLILTILCFVAIVFILRVVLAFVGRTFSYKNNEGFAGIMDWLLGLLLGAILGILYVFVFLALLLPVAGLFVPEQCRVILGWLDSSVIAGDLYNNNLLLILFRDFLNFSV